jgi:hypothetical protein
VIRETVVVALSVVLCVGPPTLAAQDESDSVAYRALTQTPLDAFSPALGVALTAHRGAGLAFHARYGLMSFRSHDFVHNFGIGADLPLAAGRLGVTLGHYGPDCSGDNCPGHFIASLEFEQGLLSAALGRPDHGGSLNLGINAGLGFGSPSDATLFAAAASLPVTLVPRMGSTRIFPFVAPGVGFGLVDGDAGFDAGMLPTLALGVGLLTFRDRLGVVAGIDRVFLSGGNWLAGVSLRWSLEP